MGKSIRSVRHAPTGRFRTFQGEMAEAQTALSEGRHQDAMDLLGSARACTTDPGKTRTVDSLQRSILADLVKVGPHGYEHGWIKVGDGTSAISHNGSEVRNAKGEKIGNIEQGGESWSATPKGYGTSTGHSSAEDAANLTRKPLKGDSMAFEKDGRTLVGLHDGTASSGRVRIKVPARGDSMNESKPFIVPMSSARRLQGGESAGFSSEPTHPWDINMGKQEE